MRRRLRGTAKRPLQHPPRLADDIVDRDAKCARMSDRADEVRARPARHVVREHAMSIAVERRPAADVAARRNDDAWRPHRGGNVRDAGVVAKKQRTFGNHERECAERSFAGEVDRVWANRFRQRAGNL